MLPPVGDTGHKLGTITSNITVAGDCCTFMIETRDRDTGQAKEQIRFWTTYNDLQGVLAKTIEAASIMKIMMEKTGTFDSAVTEEAVRVFTVKQAGAGAFVGDLNVALQLRTEDGPVLDFALPPQLAKELGELLIAGARQATQASQSH
jgi:hypothetical protein